MTLRARLLLTVAGLLAVALVVTGLLIAGLTRASLVAQVDDQLRRTVAGGRVDRILELEPGDQLLGRSFAWLIVGPQGAILASAPSGPAREPDPLPAVPDDLADPSSILPGTIVDAASDDGSVDYRMHGGPGPRRTTLLLAAPLGDVQAATAALVRNLVLVGLLVLAVGLAIGWVLIRRDLRPLDAIAATASRIAGGDLGQRVETADPRTEVGQVGVAFNTMRSRRPSASSRPPSRRRSGARPSCAASWPMPRTSCARRSRRSAATPSCTAPAASRTATSSIERCVGSTARAAG
jgi:two-component system OmpR family sensor kinase